MAASCTRYRLFSLLLLLAPLLINPRSLVQASTPSRYQRRCRINVNRQIITEDRHVWVCRCIEPDGVDNVIGRVDQLLQPFQSTIGHEQAILRCQHRNQHRLLNACRRGSERFQKIATPIIRNCVSAPLNQAEKEMNQPFSFNRDDCTADFSRFISPMTGGLWVCNCLQQARTTRLYFVVTGRAAFLTDSSPLGAVQEIVLLETCNERAKARIERSCQSTPGDFQLLALQMLEVCCKRARVNTEQKFQCKTAVPDDVSPLKDPFLEQ